MSKTNLNYTSISLKQYRIRTQRVKKFEKLLLEIEPEIVADERYFRECEMSELTKQEVLDMRKRQRQHINKQNMRQFYKKKIRINSD